MLGDVPEGAVYILSNPAFRDGLLKIGKTTVGVDTRARGLRGTGVPAHFRIEHSVQVSDCGLVEAIVHRRLASYRCSSDREFFEVPLATAVAVLAEVSQETSQPGHAKALEKEWRATVKSTGETDRFAAFAMRVERCSQVITDTFRALHTEVASWPDVTTKIDSKIDGMTFYRDGRRFFRMDPKHSAKVDNMGVAYFGLSSGDVRDRTGAATRDQLEQDGVWIFVHDGRNNAALLRCAREAYDRSGG